MGKKILIAIGMVLFSLQCKAEPISFKHFSDYVDIKPTKKSDPTVCRAHFNAREKVYDRIEDPVFKSNKWKLVMRRGLYRAQVEMAMSELYRYFLGYSTDLDYVEEQGDFYISRREFKHFDKWDDITKKANSHYFIKEYELLDDGRLVKGSVTKTFLGLGNVIALATFFGDHDAKHYNYGVQETETQLRLIDPDLEDAFSFDAESQADDLENALADEFGTEFINMSWYQQEKKSMQKKIAVTDFSIIENIIRKHVTVSRLDSGRWLYQKILRDPTVFPQVDREYAKAMLDKLNLMDDSQFNVDRIIEQLRIRHERLREQFKKG